MTQLIILLSASVLSANAFAGHGGPDTKPVFQVEKVLTQFEAPFIEDLPVFVKIESVILEDQAITDSEDLFEDLRLGAIQEKTINQDIQITEANIPEPAPLDIDGFTPVLEKSSFVPEMRTRL
jgi:hypothetical protein